jgi:P4 family phage/plasmid primase-like protien
MYFTPKEVSVSQPAERAATHANGSAPHLTTSSSSGGCEPQSVTEAADEKADAAPVEKTPPPEDAPSGAPRVDAAPQASSESGTSPAVAVDVEKVLAHITERGVAISGGFTTRGRVLHPLSPCPIDPTHPHATLVEDASGLELECDQCSVEACRAFLAEIVDSVIADLNGCAAELQAEVPEPKQSDTALPTDPVILQVPASQSGTPQNGAVGTALPLPGAVVPTKRQRGKSARSTVPSQNALYPHTLGNDISREVSFARDAGGRLCVFENGVYRPTGEKYIQRRVKQLAIARGQEAEWIPQLAGQTVEWIQADVPVLWEKPSEVVINVLNGLLDLETLELRPHSPKFLSPIQIPITYDPNAKCPAFDRFVTEVFPEDAQELAYEVPGDLLTPERSIQKAFLFTGDGGNGKGTFLTFVTHFIGRQNVSNFSLHKLESDRFSVAGVLGKLGNICADLPSEHLVGTSIFKQVTGNDSITGERKFHEAFSFVPYCRLLFSSNHLPQSKDASKAFYDRWIVVPFDRMFRGSTEEISRAVLDARLSAPNELSGVLNKAIAAAKRLRSSGKFTEAASTRTALEDFRNVTDPLAVWLDRSTDTGPHAVIPKADLLVAYNQASEYKGRPVMTPQGFGRVIKKLRPELEEAQRTIGGKMQWVYVGIELKGVTL